MSITVGRGCAGFQCVPAIATLWVEIRSLTFAPRSCLTWGVNRGLELESLHGKVGFFEMSLKRLAAVGSVIVLLGGMGCLRASYDCLSCHGASTGLTNSQGKLITVKGEALAHSVHNDLRCLDCHAGAAQFPHTSKSASASCLACHGEVAGELAASAHSALGKPDSSSTCMACHGSAHEIGDPDARGAAFCAACHAGEVKEFASSIHGRARGRGDTDAPSCENCHGATHKVYAQMYDTLGRYIFVGLTADF